MFVSELIKSFSDGSQLSGFRGKELLKLGDSSSLDLDRLLGFVMMGVLTTLEMTDLFLKCLDHPFLLGDNIEELINLGLEIAVVDL